MQMAILQVNIVILGILYHNIIVTIEQMRLCRSARMPFLQNESAACGFVRIEEHNINDLCNGYGVCNVFNDDYLFILCGVQCFILYNNVM